MTKALILVDLMPRIIELPVAPLSGQAVLRNGLRLAELFRAAGEPVVAVRVERPGVDEQPPGSGFATGVTVPGDITIVKRTIGAFHGTELDARLREHGVDTVVVTGLVTNLGVESTARAAADHGYRVEFVADAMAGLTAAEHKFAVRKVFPRLGTVTEVADYAAASR